VAIDSACGASRAGSFEANIRWFGGEEEGSGQGRTLYSWPSMTIGAGQILVYRSQLPLQRSAQLWATYDTPETLMGAAVADVTGDGLADVILIRRTRLEVLPSTGKSFGSARVWLENVTMTSPGWHFTRVTNDARADAVLLDLAHSTVYVSTGQSCVQTDTFKQAIPLGERGNFFADVTGDGRFRWLNMRRHSTRALRPRHG
jgi:hypothetical protein